MQRRLPRLGTGRDAAVRQPLRRAGLRRRAAIGTRRDRLQRRLPHRSCADAVCGVRAAGEARAAMAGACDVGPAPSERISELLPELRVELVEVEALVLRPRVFDLRSEEHTSELQSLMRISYAVFCLKKKI